MYNIKDIKKNTPVNGDLVIKSINKMNLEDMDDASIREIVAVVNLIEKEWSEKFVRMEMGIPGLPPASTGINAQINALKKGVASLYPPIDGITSLKEEASDFVKLFMNINVSPTGCIPSVGSMEGTYSAFLAACNLQEGKDTILFIDPGFPVQKQQMQVMGGKYESFDVFNYRGEKLKEKLEEYLKKGNISAIVYSNPNNPSWICFTEEELKIIGDLSIKYDVIIFEDLAYFAMDFRKNLYTPGKAPYQSTVAGYTNRYVLFISGSKIFSYAGERIAVMAISDFLYD
ncbi:MAG: pyridoxal phosphate-dependent aminotransferase, partial [Prolixibacteraceae bacterium]|nr:pyridoxal phosphate-dependent aminotransferase [Prolixibacteraceae bacterium]